MPSLRRADSPRHHVRVVSAASLFDGHDAGVNVMRRLLQSSGAEVIHLGHNWSVGEFVRCAIQKNLQERMVDGQYRRNMEAVRG